MIAVGGYVEPNVINSCAMALPSIFKAKIVPLGRHEVIIARILVACLIGLSYPLMLHPARNAYAKLSLFLRLMTKN